MKNLYFSTAEFDKNASQNLGIDEKILMENAASGAEILIRKKLKKGAKILALCGAGNNANDAICVLRRLSGDYLCEAFLIFGEPKNEAFKLQSEIAKKVGVKFSQNLENFKFDCIIDGIFGSGLSRDMDEKVCEILGRANHAKALKIAIDIPSGIDLAGVPRPMAFEADYTVCMGALKISLFSDLAKDFTGKIKLANLGICEDKFATSPDAFLLEKSDLRLPFRKKKNTNKGEFGHAFIASGEMSGAAQIAALSAHAIGAGLVSIVGKVKNLNPILMRKDSFKGASAIGAGMGLGGAKFDTQILSNTPCVIDADLCYSDSIIEILQTNENAVITPHPKEFAALLSLAKIANLSVSEVQKDRFALARKFSLATKSVLVLKGANTIIAHRGELFVCERGVSALAKAGSGDVLSGLITGLLAQGYSSREAAINGVLAHALAGRNFRKNSYSLNPFDIIEEIKWLRKK